MIVSVREIERILGPQTVTVAVTAGGCVTWHCSACGGHDAHSDSCFYAKQRTQQEAKPEC